MTFDWFGGPLAFLACVLIMAGAQVIYATVGFGAGMVAVALMALVLPDLTGIVVVLLVLTFVTEVWVLSRAWRAARFRLLGWLVPGMAVGLWLGTHVLVTTDVSLLKRFLGLVVGGAGLYFLFERRIWQRDADSAEKKAPSLHRAAWISLPVGLISGTLGAMFGTGGPPVIIHLRACRLDKAAFRATILMFFLLMSLLRAGIYARADLLTVDRAMAALLLLPGSIVGVVIGTLIHDRISERRFREGVSVLLVLLGAILAVGAGR